MVRYRRLSSWISPDKELVSLQWFVLLRDIFEGEAYVGGIVTEGKRTMARQRQLVRELGLYNPITNPHGAARPSPFAPHIRVGRFDHAIDVTGSNWFISRAAQLGVTLTRTVSTEIWHLEANADQLNTYFQRNKARVLGIGHRTLHPGMRGHDVKHFQDLAKKKGILPKDRKAYYFYGPRAALAVRAWKKKHHYPHDSTIGSKMWRFLES